MATGLGSVDANALVTNWNAVVFNPTTTKLQVSKMTVTHGTPLTLTATVTPDSGGGTPTGAVSILTNASLPASQSQTSLPLTSGSASSTIDSLPGGDYQLTARYSGDGIHAASTSSPVEVKIAAEPSTANMILTSGNHVLASLNASVPYNQPFQINLQPTGVNRLLINSGGAATGTATFTLDSTTVTVPLNVAGIASWVPPALTPGTHTVSASYSGDPSYQASSAAAVTFTVIKGPIWINGDFFGPLTFEANDPNYLLAPGSSLTFGVTVQPGWSLGASPGQIPLGTVTPTGTVSLCLNAGANVAAACLAPAYTITVPLTPANGPNALQANAVGTFQNIASGWYMVEAQYNGDSNYTPYGLIITNWVDVNPLPTLVPTTTTLSASPSSISGSDTAQATATVIRNDNSGTTPTGIVAFFSNGRFLYQLQLPNATAGTSSSVTFHPAASWFWNNGTNDLIAVYYGDGATFGPSQSNTVGIEAARTTAADFTLAPQTAQVNVKSGSTATAILNLASLNGLNGTVSLTCAASSAQFACSLSPSSLLLNGASTASVTISAKLSEQALTVSTVPGWPAGLLAVCCALGVARKRRTLGTWTMVILLGACALTAISGCGGSGGTGTGNGGGSNPNNTPAGRYNVVVTATSGTVVHNVKLAVIVE